MNMVLSIVILTDTSHPLANIPILLLLTFSTPTNLITITLILILLHLLPRKPFKTNKTKYLGSGENHIISSKQTQSTAKII